MKLLVGSVPRVIRSGISIERRVTVYSLQYFEEGERVFVARRTALGGMKWSAFKSKYYVT